MSENEQILEKIQKLLSLATSPNENEARSAMVMAHRLLTKYNLSMDDLRSHQVAKDYVTAEKDENRAKASNEDVLVFAILQKFFFVRIVQTVKPAATLRSHGYRAKGIYRFSILGRKHNVQIASYMYDYIVRAMRDNFTRYRKQTGALVGARKSYYLGFYHGLVEQLKKDVQTTEETALVRGQDADLEAYLRSQVGDDASYGRQAKIKVSDYRAAAAGMVDGKNTQLSQGLTTESGRSQIDQRLRLENKSG